MVTPGPRKPPTAISAGDGRTRGLEVEETADYAALYPGEQADIALDPASLVGLDQSETIARLGNPSAIREEPPAMVWSYRSEDCRLEIFFYHNLRNQRLQALTYEVRTAEPGEDSRLACLSRLGAKAPDARG